MLEDMWLKEQEAADNQKRKPVIWRAIYNVYGLTYLMVGIWKLIWGVGLWLGAYYFLKQILVFASSLAPRDMSSGEIIAAAFLVCSLVCTVSIQQLISKSFLVGMRAKSALMHLIFKKSLKLARLKGGAGDVVNLVSSDCQKIADAFNNLHYLWSAGVEVTVGYSVLPALAVLCILIPLQIYIGKIRSQIGLQKTHITSRRVHVMSEILTAIKLIKFYAWECPFQNQIEEIRKKEVDLLRKALLLNAISFASVFCTPVLISILVLVTKWRTDSLDAIHGFLIISLYNTLRYPLLMLPLAVNSYSDARVALDRIDEFMEAPEVDEFIEETIKDDNRIVVKNSSFSWEGSSPFLKNISFTATKGMLIAVVGDVGSGKSSLLAALMKQMNHLEGENLIYGKLSYVPQEAWILNMILRENILFGNQFDEKRYRKVVQVCALTRDLDLMESGDQTEIGERGVNLSGGQRQRLSLARAVYHQSDLIFLDDPLSAVDQQVGRHIFDNCIKEFLKDRTRIFVTHQLQYLPDVDYVLVMKGGEIVEQGKYEELIAMDGVLKNLVGGHEDEIDPEGEVEDPQTNLVPIILEETTMPSSTKNVMLHQGSFETLLGGEANSMEMKQIHPKTQLTIRQLQERSQLSFTHNRVPMTDENLMKIIDKNQTSVFGEMDVTHHADIAKAIVANELTVMSQNFDPPVVSPKERKLVQEDESVLFKESSLKLYSQSVSGVFVFSCCCLYFFLVHLVRVLSDLFLSMWLSDITKPDSLKIFSNVFYVGMYFGTVVAFTSGVLSRGWWFSVICVKKAQDFHAKMFSSVLYAPMSFFDSTPLGRILNAFARHLSIVDDELVDSMLQALQYIPLTLGTMGLVIALLPFSAIPFAGVFLLGGFVLAIAGPSESVLKNQESITRSPIFAHITASLEGLFSIRAFKVQDHFIKLNQKRIDRNHTYGYAMTMVKGLIALWLDILTSFAIFGVVLIISLTIDNNNSLLPARVGLLVSNALQLLVFLQWSVRMLGDVRVRLSSVQQLAYYGQVKPEAPPILYDSRPPENWPMNGNIVFEGVVLRYQRFGVAVLKDVSISIQAKQKIGIVGRTGSGKSTLLISLLRIVEAAEGTITIDGLNIASIGLKDLRSKIAIIPQEPVLFVGSIRVNVDPFGERTDEEIWRALDSVHLGGTIRDMDDKLDSFVIENGKNFSVGQRQLFCIARAILSRSQILVLDEATAAIDVQTDLLIQNTIKVNFANLTVLTIAHRLNTIMESDKILVMDAGRAMEFAPPLALLDRPNSIFRDLVDKTGPITSRSLRVMAENKRNFDIEQGKEVVPDDHEFNIYDGVAMGMKANTLMNIVDEIKAKANQ